MKRLECPSCGGPLSSLSSSVTTCPYCGSSISLERDAAGSIAPTLTRLGTGTRYLAKEAQYQRTNRELAELRETLETNYQDLDDYLSTRKRPGYGKVVLFAGLGSLMLLGSSSGWDTLGLGLLATAFLIWWFAYTGRLRYDRETRELNQAVDDAEAMVIKGEAAHAKLRKELDSLARKL